MEKLDKERYLKRVIIVCWIALEICFGIKMFGGNLFEIMCENENFIKVCEYAENHFWAYYFINAIYCFVSLYFFTLAICGKRKFEKWELFVVISTVIVGTFAKCYDEYIGLAFDAWQFLFMQAILNMKNKRRHIYIIPAVVLLFIFQAISMFVKNIEFGILTDKGLLISVIYSIDVLIMILLYYEYSNILTKKGESKNGYNFWIASMRRHRRTEEDEGKET
jgi:hypothetical protein